MPLLATSPAASPTHLTVSTPLPTPLPNEKPPAAGVPLRAPQPLRRELEYGAPPLGLHPANPPAPPEPPRAPTELEEPAVPAPYDPSPFARERHVWLGLHAAATRSLAQGSVIVFS